MLWNVEQAALYDAWAQGDEGRWLRQEEKLIQRMIAPWPRSKRKILDIGCGTGLFLDFFLSCGFDVSAVEKSPDMLAKARERAGRKIDFYLGCAEHLPFDDGEFDYATLVMLLECADDPAQALREAVRIAREGILILCVNRISVHGRAVLRQYPSWKLWDWFSLRALLRKNITASLEARSLFLDMPCRNFVASRYFLNLSLFPWLGEIMAIRADFTEPPVQTPLMAWKEEASYVFNQATKVSSPSLEKNTRE